MQQIIWPVLIAFLAVMVMGPIGIPLLKKLKYGQTIYELGPQSHLAKQGVPTMGGVIIAAGYSRMKPNIRPHLKKATAWARSYCCARNASTTA